MQEQSCNPDKLDTINYAKESRNAIQKTNCTTPPQQINQRKRKIG
jgi:hypothetical protein